MTYWSQRQPGSRAVQWIQHRRACGFASISGPIGTLECTYANKPSVLTSPKIKKLAAKALKSPSMLTNVETRELGASVMAHLQPAETAAVKSSSKKIAGKKTPVKKGAAKKTVAAKKIASKKSSPKKQTAGTA